MALGALLCWNPERDVLLEPPLNPRPGKPVATRIAPNGDLLLADVASHAVLRYAPDGSIRQRYTLESGPFRPASVLCVEDEIWVSNPAAHRIEVFNAQEGNYQRSLGQRGSRAGQFGMPLGMARAPDGNVLVVDMLNARVQVLDAGGRWLRTVGGPGDRLGAFGRPKDIAVAPDGTVFVTDAGWQRVQVFDAAGQPLEAFGHDAPSRAPDGAVQPGLDRPDTDLALPNGIAITTEAPMHLSGLPDGFRPAYFLLVAEQVHEPGVRVFAWRAAEGPEPESPLESAATAPGQVNAAGTLNPHWSRDDCGTCHAMNSEHPVAIPPAQTDQLCLSCHDGSKAKADAHPTGRLVHGPDLRLPQGWPTVNDRLVCLTCHDIVRHCSRTVARPAKNPMMLRDYSPQEPFAFCAHCHVTSATYRVNPHRADPADRQLCLFCHTQPPEAAPNGQRRFDAKLRGEGSSVCLTCHQKHWDYAPGGHVDRELPDAFLSRLLASERERGAAAANAARRETTKGNRPAYFPLARGRIACYTCHNPHPRGLFPRASVLGGLAVSPADAQLALRANQLTLCLSCHDK
jgi:predicted CXXCH cytochrome family protein